jgi:hypothetical protein
MLYLNPPYHIIQGVAVFPDHADPLQFYYLPAMPHLTTVDDGSGNAVPQIQLLQFTGDTAGGFLNLTVDLGIGDEMLEEVSGEVRRIFQLDGTPRLGPVLLEDGAVRLMALGKETPVEDDPDPEPTEPTGLPEFVLKIDHPAKPSLYGDNQAIFSLQLDQAGATLVREALQGVLTPIGVVYELEFLGLRPAYNVRVHADWDRVQRHLQERVEGRVLFFSTEVDKIVDELIESRAIVIEVDNFVPDDEDAGTITNPKAALEQVKDMVLENFFEPSINPVSAEKDGWDKVSDAALKLSTLAVTGGWAGVASFGYKNVDLTRVDRKRFDFNLRERTTVRRRIFPQKHIEGLTRFLRDGGGAFELGDFVKLVNLDDPFFRHRRIRVVNRADMEADDIGSIKVSLRYGAEHRSVVLDAATPSADVDWTSIVKDGAMVPDVAASYTVTFGDVDTTERPASLRSPEFTVVDGTLEVSPRADDLYHVVNVPVTALDFPWERYPRVEVELRYLEPDNGIAQLDTLALDAQTTTARWKWFRRDRQKRAFDCRTTFRAADHRDWSTDWTTVESQEILLRDPRGARRSVTVEPHLNWSLVSTALVDLLYEDEPNGVRAEQSMRFTEADAAPRVFSVAVEDPDQRLVQYEVRFLLTNHALIELPPSVTMGKNIILRADMRGHRVVAVRPQGDFGAKRVREVRATLRYEDRDSALSYRSDYTFTSPGERAFFEYDYVDPQRRGFMLESTVIFTNGFSVRRPPRQVDADAVAVAIG